MARILYWNLRNFSDRKIFDRRDMARALDRSDHIIHDVILTALPDIIVIVEVCTRRAMFGTEGSTIVGKTELGVKRLLRRLRNHVPGNWSLVPPVYLGDSGYCEAVAVYYDNANLQFVGPWVTGPDYHDRLDTFHNEWRPPTPRTCSYDATRPPFRMGQPPLGPGMPFGPGNFDQTWNGCLPNRPVPNGFFPNAVNEDQLAGQWAYFDQYLNRYGFPAAHHRAPFYTRFLDAANRIINVWAVHTTPSQAANGLTSLTHCHDMRSNNDEVTVVVGDFNVDTSHDRARYNAVLNAFNLTMTLDPFVGGVHQPGRRPYCMTHMLDPIAATPFGTAGGVMPQPTSDVYPRFGYMGSYFAGAIHDTGAIDNALVGYGPNLLPRPQVVPTIVNTVVGKPYAALPTVPPLTNELTGGLGYLNSFVNPLPLPVGEDSTAPGAGAALANFVRWDNFGRISSTSDHLALVFDV